MMQHIFYVPILQFNCANWEQKKNEIKKQISLSEFDDVDNHYTNFRTNKNFDLSDIFSEEIILFKNQFKLDHVEPKNFWFEKCKKTNHHNPHNHGPMGYSAVCYVDYDEKEHKPLTFLGPFNNFINGKHLLFTPSNVIESTIIFFPSSLLHWVKPNTSEKERLVVSFNIGVKDSV